MLIIAKVYQPTTSVDGSIQKRITGKLSLTFFWVNRTLGEGVAPPRFVVDSLVERKVCGPGEYEPALSAYSYAYTIIRTVINHCIHMMNMN